MKKTAKTKRWMKCLNVVCFLVVIAPLGQSASSGEKGLNQAPEGFVALFNGKDLTGWKGLLARDYDNPIKRAKLSPEALAMEQARADKSIREHWIVKDGVLEFDGKGFSLATLRDYEDFEMLVDWKIVNPRGDSGIYLRGTPQVQIWDPDQHKVGSGGLYNNKKNPSKPAMIADNPIGQWNTFRIKMVGERVTVHLNGKLVVNQVVLENYWDRSRPIFPSEQIELQCHNDPIHFRNIYIREIPRDEGTQGLTEEEKAAGFVSLFNGKDLTGWIGDTNGYIAKDGRIICQKGGNVYAKDEYSDFIFRFEFKLTPGANNGLGIRTPLKVNAAYQGMELQILDDSAAQYRKLQPYQYHGSIYGVVPVIRGCQKPVGQWNYQEVRAEGGRIRVKLNGGLVVDADISKITKTMDKRPHPGLHREKGYIGFLGHGSQLEFRNIRIKDLSKR
ncbi:MAG: 3-keto-disaccharide hydrolase [Planctomycetota bacterium]